MTKGNVIICLLQGMMAAPDAEMAVEQQPSTSGKSNQRVFKNECVTHVEPIVLTQRWTVRTVPVIFNVALCSHQVFNFPTMMKLSRPGMCLRSNIFRDHVSADACWQLCLYPGGKREENANHVSLFLKMSATSPLKEVYLIPCNNHILLVAGSREGRVSFLFPG